MRRYSTNHKCPKCGFRGISTKHVRGIVSGLTALRRTCGRCEYTWDEAPLDAPESKVTVA